MYFKKAIKVIDISKKGVHNSLISPTRAGLPCIEFGTDGSFACPNREPIHSLLWQKGMLIAMILNLHFG